MINSNHYCTGGRLNMALDNSSSQTLRKVPWVATDGQATWLCSTAEVLGSIAGCAWSAGQLWCTGVAGTQPLHPLQTNDTWTSLLSSFLQIGWTFTLDLLHNFCILHQSCYMFFEHSSSHLTIAFNINVTYHNRELDFIISPGLHTEIQTQCVFWWNSFYLYNLTL